MKNMLNHYYYKNNNGRNFQYKKILSYWLCPYRQKKSFRYTAKAACGKSFSCRFSFLAARNAITKATEYAGNFLVFWFSSPSRKFWTSLSVSDTNFLVFYRSKSEKIPKNNHGLRIVKALLFIHQTDRVARKGEWKNIVLFHVSCYGFSQCWKSLYNIIVYVIMNKFSPQWQWLVADIYHH